MKGKLKKKKKQWHLKHYASLLEQKKLCRGEKELFSFFNPTQLLWDMKRVKEKELFAHHRASWQMRIAHLLPCIFLPPLFYILFFFLTFRHRHLSIAQYINMYPSYIQKFYSFNIASCFCHAWRHFTSPGPTPVGTMSHFAMYQEGNIPQYNITVVGHFYIDYDRSTYIVLGNIVVYDDGKYICIWKLANSSHIAMDE